MMLLLAAALALQAAHPAAGRPIPPGTTFYAAPVRAADHEAVILTSRSHSSGGELRWTIVRSGRWLREGNDAAATYSDFESGTSISFVRDGSGRYLSLSIARPATSDTYSRYRRERTGGRDRALGEACEIWRMVRVNSEPYDVEVLSCETRDGIQLWTRTQSRDTRQVVAETRTLSFRRRPVRRSEVLPPADLLRWAYWRDLPPLGDAPPTPSAPLDYDLRLAAAGEHGAERSRIMRRRGPWTYLESVRREGFRSVTLDNGIVFLSYEAEVDGRPVRLALHRVPAGQLRASQAAAYVRVDPPASEQVIGETCFWSGHDPQMLVTSGSNRFCLTADGLPLRVTSFHRFWLVNLTAIALSRDRPPLAAMMPPRGAFDWARWGIRPAG